MKNKPFIILSVSVAAFLSANLVTNSASEISRLGQQIATLTSDADRIINSCTNGMSAVDSGRVDQIHSQIASLRNHVGILERQGKNEAWLAEVPPGQRPNLSLEQEGISGQDAKAIKGFSITRMMLAQATGDRSGLTSEDNHVMNMAVEESQKRGIVIRGLGIPAAAMKFLRFSNDMSATGGSSGSEGGKLVKTEYRGLVTPLVDQSVLLGMGVTVFGDLRGNLEIPVISSLGTPTTKTETGAADELTATTGVKTMSPRRLPAVVDVTTQLLRQESYDVQNYIIGELSRQFSVVVDNMALNGSGTGLEPTGLFLTSGIGAVAIGTNGGPPTWGSVVALETAVDVANAARGKLAYLTSKKGKGVLKTAQRVTGQSAMLWEDGEINGYPAFSTNLIASNGTKGSGSALTKLAFGNWQDLILGFWGGVDIVTVQDRSQAITGLKSIVMEGFYDILVRRAPSFAVTTDMNSFPV